MATEHTLTLKAVLDKSDVQQQLASLESQTSAGGDTSSAASSLDKFSDSLKRLNRTIGGAAVTRSFLNLAKSAELFGEGTDKIVTQVQSSMHSMFAAMATGNVAVIAFTAALEGLNLAISEAQEEAAEDMRRTQELNKAYRDIVDAGKGLQQSRRGQKLSDLAASGDVDTIRAVMTLLEERRSSAEKEYDKWRSRPVSEYSAGRTKFFAAQIQDFDKEVAMLRSALKRATDAEQSRQDALKQARDNLIKEQAEAAQELSQARAQFQRDEADRAAKSASNIEYFAGVMQEAQKAMAGAANAQDYNAARRRFESARSTMEGLQSAQQGKKKEPKRPEAQDWASMLSLLKGPAVSGFGAAGFNMGETQGQLDEITGQLDRIIRYMGDLVNKDLVVQNAGTVI